MNCLTHTHLISLFSAQEVFGYMFWQHVGDQCFVPASHLEHLFLLVMHTELPQEQLPGLMLQLHKHTTVWHTKIFDEKHVKY